MRNLMNIKLFVLMTALLLGVQMATAYDFEEAGIYYNVNDDGTTVTVTYGTTDYNSYSGDVVIPETVTHEGVNYIVTEIGDYAFRSCEELTSIVMPITITAIGKKNGQSFINCTALINLVIPDNVATIGASAFNNCTELRSVTIGKSVTSLKGKKGPRSYPVFSGCDSITTLTWNAVNCSDNGSIVMTNIEQLILGTEVETIPNNFAQGSKITQVVLPNSLISINASAFQDCSMLRRIVIPDQVTTIGASAFRNCSALTTVTLGRSVTAINACVFQDCFSLQRIIIPNQVTTIGASAFRNCSALTAVTLGSSVTDINIRAFQNCSSLQRIDIPNSVTTIGASVFSGCKQMTEVSMGNSVTAIGEEAFNECESLTKVNISSVESWCKIIFDVPYGDEYYYYPSGLSNPLYYAQHLYINDQEITNLVIPNSITTINDYAFYCCSGITSVNIGDAVASIGISAFAGCFEMRSLRLGNSVSTIGENAFYGCNLNILTIGKSVTNLSYNPFSFCPNLTSLIVENGNPVYDSRNNCNAIIETATNTLIVGCQSTVIPHTVTSIGIDAFDGCSNLTSIFIPNSVTSIGIGSYVNDNETITYYNNPFTSCIGLKSITVEAGNPIYDSQGNCNAIIETATNTLRVGCQTTAIPSSVTAIGDYAFDNCASLTSIDIPNSVTSIGDRSFIGCTELTNVRFSNTLNTIGDCAFAFCFKLPNLNIPSSVRTIESAAFYRCTGLTSVVIPDSAIIEEYAFWQCTGLISVVIPKTVKSIGDYAFMDCSSLRNLNIGNADIFIGSFAFQNCSGLTSVTIPNAIVVDEDDYSSIGWFQGCTNLTKVTIGSGIARMGIMFWECPNITDVTCLATTPPKLENYKNMQTHENLYNFSDNVYEQATLYVPEGSLATYQANENWSRFRQIVGIHIDLNDVNLDGEVSIADVNALINMILSSNSTETGDVNSDGEVNIADINALINAILAN